MYQVEESSLTQINKITARAKLKFVVAPISVAFCLFVAYSAVLSVPNAWLLIVVLVAVGPVVIAVGGLILSFLLTRLFWRRHWISGVSMFVGLIALVLAAVFPTLAESPSRKVVDLIHVLSYQKELDQQVRELKDQGISPTIAAVAIEGFGSMTTGIAYDPTGEILLPPEKRTKSWLAIASQTELGFEGVEAQPIIGNYYSWFHY